MNQKTRICQNCKQNFVIEPEDFAFYERIKVPPPTWCPECREIRRLLWRNERALYKRRCGLCQKEVVSRVSPDKSYPMYCNSCWYGDEWDSLDYSQEYDFSKPFFEQFKKLLDRVPHPALGAANNVNSDWVNQETDDKNCYLNVGGHFNEDSAYNTYELYGKDCFDNFWLLNSELCYECINCERCYQTLFSRDCFDCRNTYFSFDCRNCSEVFGCAGLRNKRYYIFNEPYEKDEYFKFLKNNPFSTPVSLEKLQKKAMNVWLSLPHRFAMLFKTVDVTGNDVSASKNAHDVWDAKNMENCKHIFIADKIKDSYDGSSIGWGELCYEGAHSVGVYNGKFFAFCFAGRADKLQSANLEYCLFSSTSSDCFGCVGIKSKQYCILNKQYTKEEYESLVPKIIEHMNQMPYVDSQGRVYKYGEFFPPEISPFAYNETAAIDYFPLTKEQALAQGYRWKDPEERNIKPDYYTKDLADHIKDVKDDILGKIIQCAHSQIKEDGTLEANCNEQCTTAFKIIPQELEFYRRINLPLPRLCPNCRHYQRLKQRNPLKLWHRKCQCVGEKSENSIYQNTTSHQHHGSNPCPNEFETSYAPDRPEIVYCEQCYNAEVV